MSTTTAEPDTEDLLSEAEFRERLRELPPSAKLVAKVLESDAPLSQGHSRRSRCCRTVLSATR